MNIVTLKNAGYTAGVNLTRGANCISLHHTPSGTVILREPDYEKELDNPFLYGMPVLFPANRISGAAFTFEGRTYQFPANEPATGCHIHGTLHEMPFALREADEASVTAVYRATKEQPYLTFPHAFTMEIRYALTEAGLVQTVSLTNDSDSNMPVLLAFHTTFRAENVLFYDEVAEGWERDASYLPTGRVLPEDESSRAIREGRYCAGNAPFSRHCRVTGSRSVLKLPEKKLAIVYENDEKYRWRLNFTSGEGFLCVEPMTSFVNCVNFTPDGLDAGFVPLAPGATRVYTSRIGVEKME